MKVIKKQMVFANGQHVVQNFIHQNNYATLPENELNVLYV